MYLAVIGNREFPIVSGQGNWKQNEIGTMNVFVPAQLVDGLNLYLEDMTIYRDGQVYWEGLVVDYTATKGEGSVRLAQINALEPLGYLMQEYYSKTQSHYRDAPITVMISDLLSNTQGDWRLGKADSMVDRLVKTTIDLTDKESLWAQLIGGVKTVPECFVKYGGFANGVRFVDVGLFDYPVQGIISRDVLIEPLKFDRRGKMPLQIIKPRAGGSAITITLEYALDAAPWLATDANYPITVDAFGDYIVTDTSIPSGRKISKRYADIKTTTNDPDDVTAEELQEAALALYQRCIREFQESRPQLNITAVCALNTIPLVPSWWRVIGDAYEANFDYIHAKVNQARVLEFNQVMATAEVRLDFSNAGRRLETISGLKVQHERLTVKFNEIGFAPKQAVNLLAERIDENGEDTIAATVVVLDSSSAPVVVTHSAISADVIHSSGVLGKLFSFTLPAPPMGATAVYATIQANEQYVLMDVVTEPALPATDLLVYATAPFRQVWKSTTSVTITAQFYFVMS